MVPAYHGYSVTNVWLNNTANETFLFANVKLISHGESYSIIFKYLETKSTVELKNEFKLESNLIYTKQQQQQQQQQKENASNRCNSPFK